MSVIITESPSPVGVFVSVTDLGSNFELSFGLLVDCLELKKSTMSPGVIRRTDRALLTVETFTAMA